MVRFPDLAADNPAAQPAGPPPHITTSASKTLLVFNIELLLFN